MRPKWILVVLLAVIVSSTAVTWFIGDILSQPAPAAIGPIPSTLPGATSVAFSSDSGSEIQGWYAPGRPGRGTVVLAHARHGDRRGMLGRAEFLHAAGYSVLLFDAQAHGESPGERATFGYLEARDAAAAVAFAEERDTGSPVAFIGVSQGGAAALLGPSPLPVSALVLEAVYPTLEDAVANRIAIRLGALGDWLAPLLLWQVQPRLGVPPQDLAPARGIRNITAPLLVIAGERDRHTTLAQSEQLFGAAPEPKHLWVVPGAAHEDFHRVATREYEARILAFLEQALPGPRAPTQH